MARVRLAAAGMLASLILVGVLPPAGGAAAADGLRVKGSMPSSVPDGGQIVFGKYGRDWFVQRLIIQNADGTNRRVLRRDDQGDIDGVTLSPDGTRFAVLNSHGVFVRSVDDPGYGQQITTRDGLMSRPSLPRWSPDGARLAFTIMGSDFDHRSLVIADVATLEATVVASDLSLGGGPGWSPNGRWLAVTTRSDTHGCIDWAGAVYYYTEIAKIRPDGSDLRVLTNDVPWDWRLADWGEEGILGRTFETGDDGDVSQNCADDSDSRVQLLDPRSGRTRALRDYGPPIDPLDFAPEGGAYLVQEETYPGRLWRVDLEGKERRVRVSRQALGGDWGVLPAG